MQRFILTLAVCLSGCVLMAQSTILNPGPGEWPNFKRDIRHTGTVLKTEMVGRLSAANHFTKWSVPFYNESVEYFTSPAIVKLNDGITYVIGAGGLPGRVRCINGSTGAVKWTATVPDSNISNVPDFVRPLGLVVDDLDQDNNKELVVTTANSNHVYCFRLENEGGIDTAGSIQWKFTFPNTQETSEGTPTAVNLDTDGAMEVLVGTSFTGLQGPRMYAIDGATGFMNGDPFIGRQRHLMDSQCEDSLNKMDSGCPAVSIVNGQPVIYIGAWDGYLYGLEWRSSPTPGLYVKWEDSLPRNDTFPCGVAKVRCSATIGQIIPGGDEELVYGFMYDGLNEFDSYLSTPQVRIVNANGLSEIQTIDGIREWKSTPSIADVDPSQAGLEVLSGSTWGVYKLDQSGNPFAATVDSITASLPGGFRSSPAVADIDQDGDYELIIGKELHGDSTGIIVLDARTLTPEWTWYDTTRSPRYKGVVSAPSVGDIDDDGFLEFVFLATDGILYAIDGNAPLATEDPYYSAVQLFPNPATDQFSIRFPEQLGFKRNTEVRIYDLNGRLIQQQALQRPDESIACQFGTGMYIVKISIAGRTMNRRLVMESR